MNIPENNWEIYELHSMTHKAEKFSACNVRDRVTY